MIAGTAVCRLSPDVRSQPQFHQSVCSPPLFPLTPLYLKLLCSRSCPSRRPQDHVCCVELDARCCLDGQVPSDRRRCGRGLKGLTCAIKDLYDVRVHPDGPTQMWGLAMCSCINNLTCDDLPAYRHGIV